jgi:hypothetical protein
VSAPDGQLELFADNGNGRRMNKVEAGLAKEIPGFGAEALLSALVKHGLPEDALRAAARLCIALDDEARR